MFQRLGLILSLLLVSLMSNANSTPGIVPINMSVSAQGQTMVNYPIELPELASGLSPKLGISYFENYSSAILGRSFSLNGFPYIHRCRETLEIAGSTTTLEAEQASYCLDGELLKSTSLHSKTYKKRIDDNSLITLVGDVNNPTSWVVKTAGGAEYTYEHDGHLPTKLVSDTRWLLAQIKQNSVGADADNQVISYDYDKSSYYIKPKKITYNGVVVDFNYESSVNQVHFRNGITFTDSQRLSSIEIARDGKNLVEHSVNYENVGNSGYRLESLSSCYNGGKCLNPSKVEYVRVDQADEFKHSNNLILAKSASSSVKIPNLGAYTTGDIDGDGITDFCSYSVDEGGVICGNTSTPFTIRSAVDDAPVDFTFIEEFYQEGNGEASQYEGAIQRYADTIQSVNSLTLIDLNNDGYDDYCTYTVGSTYRKLKYFNCALNKQDGTFGSLSRVGSYYAYADGSFPFSHSFIDINYDGYVDICNVNRLTSRTETFDLQCRLNNQQGKFDKEIDLLTGYDYKPEWNSTEDYTATKFNQLFLDLNNDQSPDFCYAAKNSIKCLISETVSSSGAHKQLSLINEPIEIDIDDLIAGGYSTLSNDEQKELRVAYETLSFVDVNKDKTPDICYIYNNTPTCLLNDGQASFDNKVTYPVENIAANILNQDNAYSEDSKSLLLRSMQFRDWDSDGYVDICWVNGAAFMCALGNEGGFLQPVNIGTMQLSLDVMPSLQSRKKKSKSTLENIGNAYKKYDRPTYYSVKNENSLAFGPVSLINDTDGDGRNELCYRSNEGIECIDIARSNINRIKATENSLGLRKSVRYKSTLKPEIYSNTAGLKAAPTARYRIINPVREVVSNLYFDNGHAGVADDLLSVGMNETQFKYSAYSQNLDGYSPGFLKVEESNLVSGLRLTQHYYNDSKLIGELSQTDEFEFHVNEFKLYKQAEYAVATKTNGYGGVYRQLTSNIIKKLNVNDGTEYARQTLTYSDFDTYNFPKNITDISTGHLASDKRKITNVITYDHKPNLRLLGLREQELTTIESNNALETLYPATKSVFDDFGRLTQQTKTIHDGTSITENYKRKLISEFSNFDRFGQAQTITKTAATGFAGQTDGSVASNEIDAGKSTDLVRTTTRKYNEKGLLESESNDLDHKTHYYYETQDAIRCQQPSRISDVNARETQISYDDLCRQDSIINNDGSAISYDWQWDASLNRGLTAFQGLHLSTPSVYRVIETEQLKSQRTSGDVNSQKITFYDRFQRQLRNITIGDHSQAACDDGAEDIFVDYAYDYMGRMSGVTHPYGACYQGLESSNVQVWQAKHYDGHGRLTSEVKQTENGDSIMNYLHSGNTTTISLANSNRDYEKVITASIHGEPLKVESTEGDIVFTRNGLGLVTSVTRDSFVTDISYDDYGNKTEMEDPDMGTWSYTHNGFSELVQQTDANNQITSLIYDGLGRLTNKVFAGSAWEWEYDPKDQMGALDYHQTSEGTKRQYEYDALGRVESDTLTINAEPYKTSFVYDDANRVIEEIQQSGVVVHRDYDLLGRLLRVSMPKDSVTGYNLEVIDKAIDYLNASILTLRTEVESNVAAAKIYAEEAKRLQTHALNLSNISNVDLEALEALNAEAAAAFAVKEAAEARMNASQEQLDTMIARGMDHFVAIAKDNIGTIDLYHTKSYRRKETNGTKTGKYLDADTVTLIDTATQEGKQALATAGVRGEQCYRNFKRNKWGRWIGKNHCKAGIHPVNYYTHLTHAYTQLHTGASTNYDTKQAKYLEEKAALIQQVGDGQEAMAQAKEAYDQWRTNSLNFQAKQEELWAVFSSRDELTSLKNELNDLNSEGNVMLWAATRYRADGQLQSEQFGNGYRTQREFYPLSHRVSRIKTQLTASPLRDVTYVYDQRGNLATKTGDVLKTLESYEYNDTNGPDRLTDWSWQQVGNNDVAPITRNYTYNQYGGMTIDKGDDLEFDAASHQVDKVTQADNTKVDYQYDNNGNVKSNGLGLNITWNAFNKPASISSSAATHFTYQAGGQRVLKEINTSANQLEKTVYINPGLELVEKQNSNGDNISQIWRHHIRVGNDVVATVEKTVDATEQNEADKVAFIHRDILGNPETITDIHGNSLKVNIGRNMQSSHRLYSPYGELLGYISETDEVLAQDTGSVAIAGTYRESLEAKSAAIQKVADLVDQVSVRQRSIQNVATLNTTLTYTSIEAREQAVREKKAREDAALRAATTYIFIGGSIPIFIPLVDESKIPPPEPDIPEVNISNDLAGVAGGFTAVANNINASIDFMLTEEGKEALRIDPEPDDGSGGKVLDGGNIEKNIYRTATASVASHAVTVDYAKYKAFAHKIEFTPLEQAQHQGSIAGGLRGFTSHEALAEHGLVHMNARIYDPKNGRFLSADTLIPNPNNWDSYNRYMYVEGNPMRYRDPSGHNGVSLTEAEMGSDINTTSFVDTSGLDDFNVSNVEVTVGTGNGNGNVTIGSNSTISVTEHSNSSGFVGGSYKSENGYYHYYEMENEICTLSTASCSASAVWGELKKNPAPGWDSSKQVASSDETHIDFAGVSGGDVSHIVDDANMILYNVTHPNHIFADGYVSRAVISRGDSIFVRSIGEGVTSPGTFWIGPFPLTRAVRATMNMKLYQLGFNALDSNIRGAFSQ